MALPVPRGRQIDILAMKAQGHIVVLGAAGSGKSTVAALRAHILADPRAPHHGKTLLVTYNKSLVRYLKTVAAEELRHVQVETFHSFAFGYLNARGKMHWRKVVSPHRRDELIRTAVENSGIAREAESRNLLYPMLLTLISREFTVIARAGMSRAEYIAYQMRRGGPLAGFGPDRVYDVLEAYRAIRDSGGERYDFDDMLSAAWEAMRDDQEPRMYKHIVIDEGQDFAPVMLKTLIAAVPSDGSVTFLGDVAQQIYGRETNWRAAGFDVEKAVIFEENLRNTREIALLGEAIGAMPYYRGVPDIVRPSMPVDAGPLPTLVRCSSKTEELGLICTQARNAVGTQNVAIICPNKRLARIVLSRLEASGERSCVLLNRDLGSWYSEPRIYVGTYHNAKGLEFGSVLLPFVSAEYMPDPWLVEVFGPDEAASLSGSLLYVGVTRCRRNLVITYHGDLSPLLPDEGGTPGKLYQRLG